MICLWWNYLFLRLWMIIFTIIIMMQAARASALMIFSYVQFVCVISWLHCTVYCSTVYCCKLLCCEPIAGAFVAADSWHQIELCVCYFSCVGLSPLVIQCAIRHGSFIVRCKQAGIWRRSGRIRRTGFCQLTCFFHNLSAWEAFTSRLFSSGSFRLIIIVIVLSVCSVPFTWWT